MLAHIFISHPHWDHINALPFFAPLYVPGNEFEILGAATGGAITKVVPNRVAMSKPLTQLENQRNLSRSVPALVAHSVSNN